MMPEKPLGLRFGPLGPGTIHLCVDMQRLFAEDTAWHTPWMERVLPRVVEIAGARPERTVFTRFIPAEFPGQGVGSWARYYRRWSQMTLSRIDRELIELTPQLAAFAPPGRLVDKTVYSPWPDGRLRQALHNCAADTLIITGGETDVCVLSTVLGAIDYGYRVVLVEDALCSSSDATHDALMTVYASRFGQQVEIVSSDDILKVWR